VLPVENANLHGYRPAVLIFCPFTKAILLNNKYYIYNSKKVYTLNLTNGKLSESRLPNKIDPKEIGLVLDEFQININNLPSAGGDYGAMYVGDVGGGDAGGGDSGGGEG